MFLQNRSTLFLRVQQSKAGWRKLLRAHAQIVYKEILSRAQIDVPLYLSHFCV